MKFTTWTHVEGREVFAQIRKQFGKDIEGDFNEQYTPGPDCSIGLYMIPPEEYEDYGEEEILITKIITKEAPYLLGKTVYIDIDY